MRRLLWIPLLLSHCSAPPPPIPRAEPGPPPKVAIPQAPAGEVAPPPADPVVTTPARLRTTQAAGIRFEGVSFDSRNHRLLIVDQTQGPGSRFQNAAAAGRSRGAIAAINAGFFDPAGRPLGRVVSQGAASGPWNQASSLCSGTWLVDSSGRMAIRSRRTTTQEDIAGAVELLQSGPMLVLDFRAVPGLHGDKQAERSLLLWDGGHRWWLGRSSACSLRELGDALARNRIPGWTVRHALNLDGGSSSELWVSGRVQGGPHHASHWWLKPARNYLVLVDRAIEP